jgi:hypothetical protein
MDFLLYIVLKIPKDIQLNTGKKHQTRSTTKGSTSTKRGI